MRGVGSMRISNFTWEGERMTLCQCGTCGVHFAVPQVMYDTKSEEGGFITCPNGDARGWKIGSLRDQLRDAERARDRAKQDVAYWQDQHASAERSANAYKGHLTRTKRRVHNGVCPCCKRHFKNLELHMKNKHPDYVEDDKPRLEVVA